MHVGGRRFLSLLLVFVVFTCIALRAGAGEPLHFAIPAGWIDLSPGAATPAALARARQMNVQTPAGAKVFAMDLDHVTGGFATNLNVMVAPGAVRIPSAVDSSTERSFADLVTKSVPAGVQMQVASVRTVPIGGADVIRIESSLSMNQKQLRTLQFIMNGDNEHATLTYTALAERFDGYASTFEDAAMHTTGVKAGSFFSNFDWSRVWIGMGIGALAGVVSWLVKRARG